MTKRLASHIAKLALAMARVARGAVSMYGAYQPDEPDMD